tara:strand:+ start:1446 stop:2525 length:1080 start_codon:yes stop_codon:yes gene_type:complete
MKPILVTCVYDSRSDWLVGGKDNDEELYETSLKNLSNLGMPMHLYCWPWRVELLTKIVERHFKEFKVIGLDLFEWPRSYEILETKNKFVWHKLQDGKDDGNRYLFAPRNELLCHWKLEWCRRAKDNEWGCDKVVWIDAGVTEWCKVPVSLGGAEYVYSMNGAMGEKYPDSHYYPKNKNNIFTPKFTNGLKRIWKDKKWFNLTQGCSNDRLAEYDWKENKRFVSKVLKDKFDWKVGGQYDCEDPEKRVFEVKEPKVKNVKSPIKCEYPAWTVGTIFGGSFKELDEVIFPLYMELLDLFTDNTDAHPFTEEPFYSIIAEVYNYNLFWFDAWSHDKEDEPCCHTMGKKPFYTTILDIINYEN